MERLNNGLMAEISLGGSPRGQSLKWAECRGFMEPCLRLQGTTVGNSVIAPTCFCSVPRFWPQIWKQAKQPKVDPALPPKNTGPEQPRLSNGTRIALAGKLVARNLGLRCFKPVPPVGAVIKYLYFGAARLGSGLQLAGLLTLAASIWPTWQACGSLWPLNLFQERAGFLCLGAIDVDSGVFFGGL